MAHLHQASSARGDAVCLLYAFRQAFYARFGYAPVSPTRRLRVSPHSIPRAWRTDGPEVRAAGADDRAAILGVYERALLARTGLITRSERFWDARLVDERRRFFVAGDPVRGYVSFSVAQLEEHAKTTLTVRDSLADDDWTARALYGVLGAQRDQVDEIEIDLDESDPVDCALVDPDRGRFGTNAVEHAIGEVVAGPLVRIVDFVAPSSPAATSGETARSTSQSAAARASVSWCARGARRWSRRGRLRPSCTWSTKPPSRPSSTERSARRTPRGSDGRAATLARSKRPTACWRRPPSPRWIRFDVHASRASAGAPGCSVAGGCCELADRSWDVAGRSWDVAVSTCDVAPSTCEVPDRSWDVAVSTCDVAPSTCEVPDRSWDVPDCSCDGARGGLHPHPRGPLPLSSPGSSRKSSIKTAGRSLAHSVLMCLPDARERPHRCCHETKPRPLRSHRPRGRLHLRRRRVRELVGRKQHGPRGLVDHLHHPAAHDGRVRRHGDRRRVRRKHARCSTTSATFRAAA